MCIAWEISVHDVVGEVMADDMGAAVHDGASIIIISLSETVLIGGYFEFRPCGIFTLFLMLKVCAVDFCHQFVYFGSEVLVL